MDSVKYIGMDVHKEAISVAVLNSSGKLVMECTIETKASTILDFLKGLRGSLHVTFEEGTWAAWLYDLIKPHVAELVVCNPRRNALLKEGSKSDRIDARKLAELLRSNMVRSVYHGENGVRTLRELARSYLTISTDLIRVMTRVKAIYRSWGIPCRGKQVYAERHRAEWLGKIQEAGVRRRAEFYYQQLDALRALRQEVRRELLAEAQKHDAWKLLREIPFIGPIRAALLIALMQTPHRFRTKRQLWSYSGFGIETHSSAEQTIRPGRAAAREEAGFDSWAESQSQSRTEESFQGCCHRGRCEGWSVQRVLRCAAGQGNPAGNGAADFGAQDGRHHLTRLEERSALRRPTSETTNSLNVSSRSVPSWNFFRCGESGSGDIRVRGRVSAD